VIEANLKSRRSLALAAKVNARVDAVLCTNPENIYYFTGFRTILYTRFVAVLIRMDCLESPILIVSTTDQRMIEDRIWSPPWISEIVFHGPDQKPGVLPSPEAALASHLEGVARIGVDSLRLVEVDQLHRAAPNLEVIQVSNQIDEVRLVKEEQELAFLRQANLLAMQGMDTVSKLLEAGPVTEIEIAVQLDSDARLAGADGFGYPTLISSGGKMAALHSPPLNRKVEPDQALRVAFGPAVEGYTADVVRTFSLGNPPHEIMRLQDGYLAALEKLFNMIRPGVKADSLLASVEEIYVQWGIHQYWKILIGHGIGLTVHEPPRMVAGSQAVLTEGMVIAVEPYLVMPGLGGYAQCDVVVVKESGPEILAPGKQGLILVPKGD
jgi:Xaa-Pro dipeptidase